MSDISLAVLAARVDDLARRVEVLEAERAILDRLAAYGHTIDAGDEAGWLDCFTRDGRFSVEPQTMDRPPLDVLGREALEAFIQGHSRPPETYHQHGLLEPRICLAPDRRSATCTAMMYSLMRHPGSQPVMRVFGRYLDQLVLESDGAWRFRWRRAIVEASTPGLPSLVNGRTRG
jgi:hypothetical protein